MTDGPNLKRLTMGTARLAAPNQVIVRLTTDDGKDQELAMTPGVAASFVNRIVSALAAQG